mmetsp:Transcript_124675/g.360678  ORF Transcript_124675/g.360678 Transcript_124675/m.360678 type:complete len:435 (+) Transcript_124675:144-1448(+)
MGKNNKKKRKRSLSADSREAAPPTADRTQQTKSKADAGKDKKPNAVKNPLLDKQHAFLYQESISDAERKEFFSDAVPSERRAQLWMDQADLGEELVNRYAWATPDPVAIRILKEFSPLVEVGCGSNAYWCKILREAGVDIVGYDVNVDSGGKIEEGSSKKKKKKKGTTGPSYLKQGGPEVLETEELQKSGRTLFLCYPDEDDVEEEDSDDGDDEEELPSSMGWQCLHHYSGDYVIHVGETFMDANLSVDQAPWGRSTSAEFQQRLSSDFHCLLKVELPNWFHTRDTISVWKRSSISTLVFAAEDEDDEDEEVEYRHIPQNERLPTNLAAPCLAHLLPQGPANGKSSTLLSVQKDMTPSKKEDPASAVKQKRPDQSKQGLETDERTPSVKSSPTVETSTKKQKKKKKKRDSSLEAAKKEMLSNLEKELDDDDNEW